MCAALRALAADAAPSAPGMRDDRSVALFELGALLATGGSPASYHRRIAGALAAGISADEIVDALLDLAPTIGLARLVPVTLELAAALGYDIDRALEDLDDPR